MKWISLRCPLLRPRSELTCKEISSPEFTKRRARAVDFYILAWLAFEILTTYSISITKADSFVSAAKVDACIATFVEVAVFLRILEIVQVTVNAALFDAISGRQDEKVASVPRSVTLAGINFLELIICFGIVYAGNFHSLQGAGQPVTAFYFSAITQFTIGYGDVHPTGWLRVVAALQGLFGFSFVVLVFARFLPSLNAVTGALGQRTHKPANCGRDGRH
jgi:hypothetical protein